MGVCVCDVENFPSIYLDGWIWPVECWARLSDGYAYGFFFFAENRIGVEWSGLDWMSGFCSLREKEGEGEGEGVCV